MLEVGMSELLDTGGVKDISPGRGPSAANTEVEHPLGVAPVVRYDSDCESLHAMRGVDGIMPRRQNCGSVGVGGVSELCNSATIVEDNQVCVPGDVARNPRGGVSKLYNSTTIVEDNQVCAPLDAVDATGSTSWKQPVSSGRKQRRHKSAVRRVASDASSMTSGITQDSEMLYTLVHGLTGNVESDVSLQAMPSVDTLLEMEELSLFGVLHWEAWPSSGPRQG